MPVECWRGMGESRDEDASMPQTNAAPMRALPGERTLRSVTAGVGALTVAFGLGPLVAPRLFARVFQFPAPDAAVASMERSLGVRDVVMGAGMLAVAARGGNYRPWLLARLATDAGDALAVGGAAAQGYRPPRFLTLGALALGAALTETTLYLLSSRAK